MSRLGLQVGSAGGGEGEAGGDEGDGGGRGFFSSTSMSFTFWYAST